MQRRCRKCSGHQTHVKWNAATDMMDWNCGTCGFKWETYPDDAGERAQRELQEQLNRRALSA